MLPSSSKSRREVLAGIGSGMVLLAAPRIARGQGAKSLSFGLTPVFLSSDLDLLDRLSAYLSDATGSPVNLVTRRTYQEISALVVSGQVDAAWICGYPYVQYRDALSLVAVPLWQGKPLYRSYIIVGSDRLGNAWQDTKSDIHAFSDPDSNSGYLSTTALLAEEGFRPDGFFSSTFFTYGHRNVVRAVASGLAQSGSVDGYVWEVMQELEPALTDRTRVLRKSEWLGFPPVACAARAASSPGTKALSAALLDMHHDPKGRQVLSMLRLDSFVAAQPRMFDGIAAKVSLLGRMG